MDFRRWLQVLLELCCVGYSKLAISCEDKKS